jgi:ComF family protein
MRRSLPLLLTALLRELPALSRGHCLACDRASLSSPCPVCRTEAGFCIPPRRLTLARNSPLTVVHSFARYHPEGEPGPTALARALLRFKYQRDRGCGRALAALFRRYAGTTGGTFDVVVPVPMSDMRVRERGYNQAAWLASAASRGMRIPASYRTLHKLVDDRPQAVRGARAPRRDKSPPKLTAPRVRVAQRSVLLIDDVYTTGATAHAAARALRRAGAVRVEALVLLLAGHGGNEA